MKQNRQDIGDLVSLLRELLPDDFLSAEALSVSEIALTRSGGAGELSFTITLRRDYSAFILEASSSQAGRAQSLAVYHDSDLYADVEELFNSFLARAETPSSPLPGILACLRDRVEAVRKAAPSAEEERLSIDARKRFFDALLANAELSSPQRGVPSSSSGPPGPEAAAAGGTEGEGPVDLPAPARSLTDLPEGKGTTPDAAGDFPGQPSDAVEEAAPAGSRAAGQEAAVLPFPPAEDPAGGSGRGELSEPLEWPNQDWQD